MLIRLLLLMPLLAVLPAAEGRADALSRSDRAIYREAFAAAEHGRLDDALAQARRADDPLLAKVLRWRKLIRPGEDPDFAAVADFLAANPDWPGQLALRRAAERAMPQGLPAAAVIAWFAAQPPVTDAGVLRYGQALLAAGREAAARALAREAWVERDLGREDERAFRAAFGNLLSAADDRERLERLIWDRRRAPALRLARRLGADALALTEARLRLAERAPGVDAAIAAVPPALREDPGLTYERALWRLRKDRYRDAVALLDPPATGLAQPARWWSLRQWAARRALHEGDISLAYRLAAGHGLEEGLGFAEGEFLAGWIALRFLREPGWALEHFTRLFAGVSTPISRSRGAFWAGEAAHALDRHDQADTWYRRAAAYDYTFYGQLAALRLGRRPAIPASPASLPDAAARAQFAERELVRILRRLAEVGARDQQAAFFAVLRADAESEPDYRLVAELAVELARYDEALRTAKSAAYHAGAEMRAHLYPLPPLDLEDETDLTRRALLLGLIRQESSFDPGAISPAGARGLMQLMPGTAKAVAQRLGAAYDRARLTEDPAYNMTLGRDYFGQMLARFDGALPLAIAAYNAGPARVQRWLVELGDPRDPEVDAVDWIESIPFGETRNYVQRVLEAANVYSRMLDPAGDPFAGLPRLLQTSQRR